MPTVAFRTLDGAYVTATIRDGNVTAITIAPDPSRPGGLTDAAVRSVLPGKILNLAPWLTLAYGCPGGIFLPASQYDWTDEQWTWVHALLTGYPGNGPTPADILLGEHGLTQPVMAAAVKGLRARHADVPQRITYTRT